MSALEKQLKARKVKTPSRIVNKQKKFLAMMEEETVIDDPKAPKLLDYKKIEVSVHNIMCFCVTTVVGQISNSSQLISVAFLQ